MGKTVAETIKDITRDHLVNHKGLLLGQAITAVGWVNNTVPDCPGIVELSNADVAGAGIAVGVALSGRRPIFVLRFQDFIFLASSPLINFAGKSREVFDIKSTIFIRAISTEGAGPNHSGNYHNLFMHVPGFRVWSPMTPKEYEDTWKDFMDHDDPVFVSEHRKSFQNTLEMPDIVLPNADITLYAISITRFNVLEAIQILDRDGIKCNVIHLVRLKPCSLDSRLLDSLSQTKAGMVIDSGYEISGASQSIAYQLMMAVPGSRVKALGIFDIPPAFAPQFENRAPEPIRIVEAVKDFLKTL